MPNDSAAAGTTPITDALVQVTFAVLDVLTRSAADLELSLTQLRLIGILRDRSPSMAALADFLALDRSSVSGLIDRAERRGLVSRRTADHDARVTLVELTRHGLDTGARIAATVADQLEAVLATGSAADRAGIVHLTAALADSRASERWAPRGSNPRPTD